MNSVQFFCNEIIPACAQSNFCLCLGEHANERPAGSAAPNAINAKPKIFKE